MMEGDCDWTMDVFLSIYGTKPEYVVVDLQN